MFAMLFAGCHRGYHRRQADADAQSLIEQKSCDPRWNQIDPTIQIDPRSRMFDPFSEDHPPLPPDDPESHKLMEFTDGKPNYPHWHANGDTPYVENPEWISHVPMNEKGEVVLNMDTAVNLALIHSTDFQTQRETLYRSALDVSLQRFGFDSQLFASVNGFFRSNGPSQGGQNQLNVEAGRLRLQRLGITGSTLAIGLANTIMWNFAGADSQSASTLLDFSLVQPLLRGAGRDRIMESLTQSERTLLADVRQMERFRGGFYLNVTTGRNAGQGPGGNGLSAPGGGGTSAGGFLGLLSDLQSIRIAERNVRDQKELLEQFQAFFREERINLLQVTQFETNLYSAQRSLAQSRTNFQTSLDSFKQTLGLPPDIPVVVEDDLLGQFELISDEVFERQEEIKQLRDQTGVVLTNLNRLVLERKFDTDEQLDGDQFGISWTDEYATNLAQLIPVLESIEPLVGKLNGVVVKQVEEDFAKLDAARPERLSSLERLRKIISSNPESYDIETAILAENEVAEVETLKAQLKETLDKLEPYSRTIDETIQTIEDLITNGNQLSPKELFDQIDQKVSRAAPELLTRLSNYILEVSLVQARTRTDAILLPEVDISWPRAVAIARCFRLDWMNARAALVDRYRQIEFVADDLESQLDLVFEGDIGNDGNNPFKIDYDNTSLGIGLRFDAPITRISERNRYRQALINYQQSRRQYYQFKDAVKRTLRQEVRNIELNKILFELDRRAVRIAVQQVELARLALEEPAEVRSALQTGTGLSQQVSRDLTDALNTLQRTQNSFLNTWVNFEAQRRSLDFDLGTMQLTPDGNWIDPGDIDETIAIRAADALGIPCQPVTNEIDPYSVDYHEFEFDSSGNAEMQGNEDENLNNDPANLRPDQDSDEPQNQGSSTQEQLDLEIRPPVTDGAQSQPVSGRSAIRPVRDLPIYR